MAVEKKRMAISRGCRRERTFPKSQREKYVFQLKKYLPLFDMDIAISTDKKMIIEKAKAMLKKLPEEIWQRERSRACHDRRRDDELRQFLKDNPDPTYYGIIIYDNTTGEVVNSVIVTEKTTLPGY